MARIDGEISRNQKCQTTDKAKMFVFRLPSHFIQKGRLLRSRVFNEINQAAFKELFLEWNSFLEWHALMKKNQIVRLGLIEQNCGLHYSNV